MRLKFISFLLIFILTFFSNAQEISQLKSTAQESPEKSRIEIYLQIGKLYFEKYAQADSMLVYSYKAFDLAQKNKSRNDILKSKYSIANALQLKNMYDSSSVILRELLHDSTNSKFLLGDIYFTLGLNLFRLNLNKEALGNYLRAIQEFQQSKKNDELALTYCRLAALFNNEGQLNEAINYAGKSAQLINKIKDPFIKVTTLSGLSGVYVQAGIQDEKYLDSSIVYAKEALDLVVKNEYYSKANQLCNSVSNAYYLKHDSLMALEYCLQSLKFRKYLLPNEILISYLNLSDCYNRLKQHNSSLSYLDSVAMILPSINDPYYQMGLYERIYAYNKDAGNLNKSLSGLERFKTLQDSLYNLEKNAAINDLMQKYNKSENEKEINELNRKNEIASLNVKILIVAILAAILIIVVIVFFYRQSVLKNKFKALETEQRLNRARMDPHFFFNALSSIQTLSMDEENNKRVPSLISKFSKIMRQSLESTYDELSTIEEEISFLTNYLDIQKLRYNNKFDYEIKVDDKLEIDELKVLGMLLQPFIENAIEHGFKNIDYKGELKISFFKEQNSLKVELSDNGVGFNTDVQHKEYPSRATQIISDRLMLLNKRHKTKAGYKLSKNPIGKGILVEVTLPILT